MALRNISAWEGRQRRALSVPRFQNNTQTCATVYEDRNLGKHKPNRVSMPSKVGRTYLYPPI